MDKISEREYDNRFISSQKPASPALDVPDEILADAAYDKFGRRTEYYTPAENGSDLIDSTLAADDIPEGQFSYNGVRLFKDNIPSGILGFNPSYWQPDADLETKIDFFVVAKIFFRPVWQIVFPQINAAKRRITPAEMPLPVTPVLGRAPADSPRDSLPVNKRALFGSNLTSTELTNYVNDREWSQMEKTFFNLVNKSGLPKSFVDSEYDAKRNLDENIESKNWDPVRKIERYFNLVHEKLLYWHNESNITWGDLYEVYKELALEAKHGDLINFVDHSLDDTKNQGMPTMSNTIEAKSYTQLQINKIIKERLHQLKWSGRYGCYQLVNHKSGKRLLLHSAYMYRKPYEERPIFNLNHCLRVYLPSIERAKAHIMGVESCGPSYFNWFSNPRGEDCKFLSTDFHYFDQSMLATLPLALVLIASFSKLEDLWQICNDHSVCYTTPLIVNFACKYDKIDRETYFGRHLEDYLKACEDPRKYVWVRSSDYCLWGSDKYHACRMQKFQGQTIFENSKGEKMIHVLLYYHACFHSFITGANVTALDGNASSRVAWHLALLFENRERQKAGEPIMDVRVNNYSDDFRITSFSYKTDNPDEILDRVKNLGYEFHEEQEDWNKYKDYGLFLQIYENKENQRWPSLYRLFYGLLHMRKQLRVEDIAIDSENIGAKKLFSQTIIGKLAALGYSRNMTSKYYSLIEKILRMCVVMYKKRNIDMTDFQMNGMIDYRPDWWSKVKYGLNEQLFSQWIHWAAAIMIGYRDYLDDSRLEPFIRTGYLEAASMNERLEAV